LSLTGSTFAAALLAAALVVDAAVVAGALVAALVAAVVAEVAGAVVGAGAELLQDANTREETKPKAKSPRINWVFIAPPYSE
jgi:hypothetical protein